MALTDALHTLSGSGSEAIMRGFLIEDVRSFCRHCDSFIGSQYRDFIRGNPTHEQLEKHRTDLQWGLRFARLFYRITSAPDFPDCQLASLLEAKLRQLEESWKYLFERPSKE